MDGFTPLMWSVFQNNKPLMHQLLAAGADPYVKDKNNKVIVDRETNSVIKAELIQAIRIYENLKKKKSKTTTGNDVEDENAGEDDERNAEETPVIE